MVQAWIYDTNSAASPQDPHFTSPIQPVSLSTLASLGVLYWRISTIGAIETPLEGELGAIRSERGYKNHDIINLSTQMNGYADKLKIFFQEHLHEDEEIRFCVDGSGYFDVRSDVSNEWIRIHVTRGDMIVLPAGMYHRFITDSNDFMQAMRLFKDAPRWEAINRGEKADQTAARAEYSKFIQGTKQAFEQKEKNNGINSAQDTKSENADSSSSSSSSFVSTVSDIRISSHSGANGESFILQESAASSLANYPHLRAYGGLLYVSGISSRRPDNTHVGATRLADGSFQLDVSAQTAAVLDNIGTILLSAGSNLQDVLDITVFLTDMENYAQFNKTYNKYFPVPERAPTRTTVAVKQLPHPNLLIEIKAVAVDRRYKK